MIYAVALLLFAGFVAVFLVDRRHKRRQAAVPIQRADLDPPADPAADPDAEPDAWPPTR